MGLLLGTHVGPYAISGLLGTGGMGEVYRARDTRLGREVALKVLPADVADDPGRRQRFESEARALAALSHPNVTSVFDVGADSGVFYLVTELIDGTHLSGSHFGVSKALDIAVQIADGLAAAHAAGIVHRDLKPGNILLTRDGRVKIIDFGLAKTTESPGAATGATETLTLLTEPGVVMGTVPYMSPEQIRGLPADCRSDIFSFGLVLHELLAGRPSFHGETPVDTLQAILRTDAPELPPGVPVAVRQIVMHCLEKDPSKRFQSARDLCFALSAFGRTIGPTPSQSGIAPKSRMRRPTLITLGLTALLLLAVVVDRYIWRSAPHTSWSGSFLGGPEYGSRPRVSPDGHTLAFLTLVGEQSQVAVMKPETGNWSVLTHNTERGEPHTVSWSPDGTRIYFDRISDVPHGIFSVPAFGGQERLVVADAVAPEALPDGSLLLSRLDANNKLKLSRYWPQTGRIQAYPVSVGQATDRRAFPDGRHAVVFGIGEPDATHYHTFQIDLDSGRSKVVEGGDDAVLAVTRSGKVVTATASGNLFTVRMLGNGAGRPEDLFTTTNRILGLDVGPDGSIYADQWDQPAALVRFSASGGPVQRLHGLRFEWSTNGGAVLPDGRVIVASAEYGRTRLMVWEPGKEPVPMLSSSDGNFPPVAALGPDEVAFVTGDNPLKGPFLVEAADVGTGTILRRITTVRDRISTMAATPDGKIIFIASGGNIWSVPSSGGEPRRIRQGNQVCLDPTGKSLLVEVYKQPMIHLLQVSMDGSTEQEISLHGPYRISPYNKLGSGVMGRNRILVGLLPTDSSFASPGVIDLATGQMTRLPVDRYLDYTFMARTPSGDITAIAAESKSVIWKFEPKDR